MINSKFTYRAPRVSNLFGIAIMVITFCLMTGCDVAGSTPNTVNTSPSPSASPSPSPSPSASPVPREWTIMVYMGGDNGLANSALSTFTKMESVDQGTGSITILALVDQHGAGGWSGTRLYEVKYNHGGSASTSVRLASETLGLSTNSDTNLDTGSADTVKKFVEFGKQVYPANHYAFIFWGQGIGAYATRSLSVSAHAPISRGVIYDQTSNDELCTDRMRLGLEGKGIDLIGIDASFGASIEHAYELKDCASILVASEDGSYGWDYSMVIPAIRDSHASVRAVGDAIVTACTQSMATSPKATISEIDLSKLASLNTALNTFSDALRSALTTDSTRTALRNSFFSSGCDFYTTPGDLYKDIFGLSVLAAKAGYASAEASTLQSAISAAVLQCWSQGTPSSNAEDNPHGLMVYYVGLSADGTPLTTFPTAFFKDRTVNDPLLFVRDSTWVPDATNRTGLEYRLWMEAMQ